MEPRLILVNLLIKLGVAASAASILGRSVEFKSLLFREERTLAQKIYLVLWIGFPIALGVWIRFIQKSFFAGDLSFETTILLGVIGGRFTGMLGGALLSAPALLHGEWATMPFMLLCGLIAGQLRERDPEREEIWSFSPFVDLSIYRWFRRNLPRPRPFEWQTIFFFTHSGSPSPANRAAPASRRRHVQPGKPDLVGMGAYLRQFDYGDRH